MATQESYDCKSIERELKALILPSENQQSKGRSNVNSNLSGNEVSSYENDYPVLGSENQKGKGKANRRNIQRHVDNRKGNECKGGKKNKLGAATPVMHVNGAYSTVKKNDCVQKVVANRVIVDLSKNPVAPPEHIQRIDLPVHNTIKPQDTLPTSSKESHEPVFSNEKDLNVEVMQGDNLKSNKKKQRKRREKGKAIQENKDKDITEMEMGANTKHTKKQKQKQETIGSRTPLLKTPENRGRRRDKEFYAYMMNTFSGMRERGNKGLWGKRENEQRRNEKIMALEEECVYFLRKPSQRYPGAQFLCRLCHYHCNFDNVDRHIASENHKNNIEIHRTEMLLKSLPYPSKVQTDAISELLEKITTDFGLSEQDMEIREGIVERLNTLVTVHIPGCSLVLYGSSITGFGLKDSDVNIDVIVPSTIPPPTVLSKLYQLLRQQDDLSDVRSEFDAKLPRITFFDTETGLFCDISWNNIQATQTSKLLADYSSLNQKVKILGKAFRYWAKMCRIDCQEKGTLPAHIFSLLLVYFLQQHKPAVLPVLHELSSENDIEKYLPSSEVDKKWKSYNEESIGELWLELFRFYSVDFSASEFVVCIRRRKHVLRSEKKWTGKVMAVEDPYCRKRNLTRSVSSQNVYRYIQKRFLQTYRYFGIPQRYSGPLFEVLPKELLVTEGKYRVGQEDRPPIREYEDDHKAEINGDDVASSKFNEAVDEERSDDDDDIVEENYSDHEPRKFHDSSSDADGFEDQDPYLSMDDVVSRLSDMDLGALRQSNRTESESSDAFDISSRGRENGKPVNRDDEFKELKSSAAVMKLKKSLSLLVKDELNYRFTRDIFTQGTLPPTYCSLCSKGGHLKQDCPDMILPALKPLPTMTQDFLSHLDQICIQIMDNNSSMANEVQERKLLVQKLEGVVTGTYPDATLNLYGSSCNGFGFCGSDLDVCVTLESNPTGDKLNFAEMISALAANFGKHKDFTNVHPITTAKVPIVKVTDKKTNIECDISFYNTLALHNTRMLKLYSEIDSRARALGYVLKHFAKLCDICDASRGSLSSYAYILMVIHFLQQRKPPVLPVLQELYDHSGDAPQFMVEGWNTWFYDNMEELATVWPDKGKNKESVGELWIGLLKYYAKDFNQKGHVICIRKKDVVTRFEKMWLSKGFAIEDPFDLNHNLGSGVSVRMHTFIMKAFINGRTVFGTPIEADKIPQGCKSLKDYLFDPKKLKDGQPPNDRGCRICSKIGHKMNECPEKKQDKNRYGKQNNRQKERKQYLINEFDRDKKHRSITPPRELSDGPKYCRNLEELRQILSHQQDVRNIVYPINLRANVIQVDEHSHSLPAGLNSSCNQPQMSFNSAIPSPAHNILPMQNVPVRPRVHPFASAYGPPSSLVAYLNQRYGVLPSHMQGPP